MDEDLARCVGLWLAEGDTKTSREVTFTNNCFELVELFHQTLKTLEPERTVLQIYKPEEESDIRVLPETETREYTDKRATKPYYLLRLYPSEVNSKWKEKVNTYKRTPDSYRYLLQGFFAGEGSVYSGARNSRIIRISQGERDEFVETMLDYFDVSYDFTEDGRSYNITRKENWDRLSEVNIARLHPRKRRRFQEIHSAFQEEHYRKGELRSMVLDKLDEPRRTKALAEQFNRSEARVCRVLTDLKKEGKAVNYKAGGPTYWIRADRNAVIISDVKQDYLNLLEDRPMSVGPISDHFSVRKSSAYKNLKRLRDFGLVEKENHKWRTVETDKEVIVL
ncbi:MAG: helix-turn-helix domain-containing protein [Candidatus Nanohaloarchaea archaeon]|nr:helix-turn-helix domain-containing protein [Candidatus Nanohaloarchaea archaeon]